MNEKYVPKKWRYFNGKPAVDYATAIRDYVSGCNQADAACMAQDW
nr:MAG TPA: hypothetical protein [Caudoviricetes sp.]